MNKNKNKYDSDKLWKKLKVWSIVTFDYLPNLKIEAVLIIKATDVFNQPSLRKKIRQSKSYEKVDLYFNYDSIHSRHIVDSCKAEKIT